ncbi:hypothetical protein RRG08_010571 [Elysia crispata]|uniref:Uncharacterized protein n=1 Tax=Elysia crispata TaxID=231223 RepID=A0AAE0ZTJ7_9GAST|nr:hypothetical protein RRG08_010571 [Elysia crispata]
MPPSGQMLHWYQVTGPIAMDFLSFPRHTIALKDLHNGSIGDEKDENSTIHRLAEHLFLSVEEGEASKGVRGTHSKRRLLVPVNDSVRQDAHCPALECLKPELFSSTCSESKTLLSLQFYFTLLTPSPLFLHLPPTLQREKTINGDALLRTELTAVNGLETSTSAHQRIAREELGRYSRLGTPLTKLAIYSWFLLLNCSAAPNTMQTLARLFTGYNSYILQCCGFLMVWSVNILLDNSSSVSTQRRGRPSCETHTACSDQTLESLP